MRAPHPAAVVAVLALSLAACSANPNPGSAGADADAGAAVAPVRPATDPGPAASSALVEEWTDALEHVTACSDVAAEAEGLVDGLDLVAEHVDPHGFLCGWATPAGSDPAAARTLEVAGEAVDLSTTMTSPEAIAAGKVLVHLPDAGLDALGGIAYALRLDGAVSSLSVTVEVPDAELTVSGAGWGGTGLDEASAVRIATAVLTA